ncbi:MAG: hypothetical protein WBK20_03345, partial [Spirochaetota bacterium]
TYNDRITKIYVDKEGNVHIEEYYRANIDVKITSKNSSVAQGEYDFVVGTHGDDKFMALNIFKNNKEVLEKIISSIKDPKEQNKIWKALNNNEIDYGMIKGREEFRLLPATNGKTQLWINLHGGSNSSTDSEGCFTIYGMDWQTKTPQKDYKKFLETFRLNQLGKIYIIR